MYMKPRMLRTCGLAVMLLGLDALALNGGSAAQEVDPAELVKDIHAIFGEHHARAVHAKGVVFEATFEPTEQARGLSKASVFAGKVQATVRLSDTTGIPEIPDADPHASPHGLAVKFTLGDGSEMDLVTHSFNGFPAATAADFDAFLKAVAASGPERQSPRRSSNTCKPIPTPCLLSHSRIRRQKASRRPPISASMHLRSSMPPARRP